MRPIRGHLLSRALIALAALAATVCLGASVRAETALDAFLDGEYLMNRRGDRAAALAAFERAARLDPHYAPARYYLSQLYAEYMDGRERDRERAIAEGETFLRLADPHSPADRDAMLRTLDRLVSGSTAFLLSSRAPMEGPGATIEQRITWRERQVELGGLERYGQALIGDYLEAGEFDRALALCDAMLALDLRPEQVGGLRSTWLHALIRAGRWADELAARERAAAERPDNASAHSALAEIYDALGRVRTAVKALRSAVALEPDDADRRLRLAQLYQRLGWRSLVEQECLEVLRIDPRNRQVAQMLVPYDWGSLRMESWGGDYSPPGGVGTMDLDTLLPVLVATRDSEVLARLADGYLYRGHTDSAIRVARIALEVSGDWWWPASILCRAYVKAGRAQEIEAVVDEIARGNPMALPRLLDAWAGALSDDQQAWTELEALLDSQKIVGHERVRRFRDYATKLADHDRRPEAIAVLERALSPRERLSVGDVGDLYQDLIGYCVAESWDAQNKLLEGMPLFPIVLTGLWEKPLAICQRYVGEAPFAARAHLLLARTYRDAGRGQDAEATYRRALDLASDEWQRARAIAGLVELLLHDRVEDAIPYLRDPVYLRNELDTRITLLEALVQAGRQGEARAALDDIFGFLSRRTYWWGGRDTQGRLLNAIKSIEGETAAIPRIQAAFDQDPTSGPLTRILIEQYAAAKQFAALEALARKMRLTGDSGRSALDGVFDALRDAGEHERRADIALGIALASGDRSNYAFQWLVGICIDAARQAGNLNEVGTRVEAEFAKDPANAAAGCLLAQLYEAGERPDDVVRVYADLAARYPDDRTIVNALLARAAVQPEQDQVALPYLERAVLRDPGRAGRHVELAGVLARMGRDQEAADEYALAFETELNPLSMYYLPDQFAVHERLGTTDDLVGRYEQFAADWPDDPVARLAAGMAYQQAGRREDALAQYEAVSDLAGSRSDVRRRLSELYRHLDMHDRALAEFRLIVDSAGQDHQRIEAVREYVALCRDLKRYREAIAAIDEMLPGIDPENWMVTELIRLREEVVKAMEAEPPAPPRLRLLISVRRLWECRERDLRAGTRIASRVQAVFEGEVISEAGGSFTYDAAMEIRAPSAVGDGTMVVTCEADRCQASGGGLLPLPAGQASFRHAVTIDEGSASSPADGCVVTRGLAPIAGGGRRCTVDVQVPWAARVSLIFPAGAKIAGDGVEGMQRDGDRFVAAFDGAGRREFAAVVALDAAVADYAPEVIVERIVEEQELGPGDAASVPGVDVAVDLVTARLRSEREFTLDHCKTEVRWALRMAPIIESGR